jgi:hypothetical protein
MAVLVYHLVLLDQQYCGRVAVLAVMKAGQAPPEVQEAAGQADQTVLLVVKMMQL